MASNSFGKMFRITTWGESHGSAIGVIIDGCPSGLIIDEMMIGKELKKRRPGSSDYVSPRTEKDLPIILSGIFEGKTTGAPIHIMIKNTDHDSTIYENIREIYRPSHANYTYEKKYGHYDYRGGGRASGRETANWVAAGAIAKCLLAQHDIFPSAFLEAVGDLSVDMSVLLESFPQKGFELDEIFCPDPDVSKKMKSLVSQVKEEGDSIGGRVGFMIACPVGIGEPIFDKLQARLAYGMMNIPGAKGFEIGEGFSFTSKRGSQTNDGFCLEDQKMIMTSNHSGGVLGGISSGEKLWGRVVFKPTSSIKIPQQSVARSEKEEIVFSLPQEAMHDPCIAIRAVCVVEAMASLVLADLLLQHLARKE